MAVEKYASKENLVRFKSNYDTEIASAIATAVAQKIAKIASAQGGKIAVTTATGEVSESGTAVADLATKAFVGNIPASASATTIVDYINEVVEDIVADLAGVLKFKGTVATVADLPASGNTHGDVYHVNAASAEYVWIELTAGSGAWEELGSVIDLSAYSTTTEMNTAIAAAIKTAIEGLDSSASQTAGADGLALAINIVDGQVTSISGSIAANTYDAYGSASAAQTAAAADATSKANTAEQNAKDYADGLASNYDAAGSAATAAAGVVGNSGDTASANTVYGAKAYADSLGSNYDAAGAASTAASNAMIYTDNTVNNAVGSVIGTSHDPSTENTVYGAKAYADSLATNYDAAGAASTAAAGVVGQSGDTASASTVYGAKAYADSLASNYATASQGSKADTALQPADIEPLSNDDIDDIFSAS